MKKSIYLLFVSFFISFILLAQTEEPSIKKDSTDQPSVQTKTDTTSRLRKFFNKITDDKVFDSFGKGILVISGGVGFGGFYRYCHKYSPIKSHSTELPWLESVPYEYDKTPTWGFSGEYCIADSVGPDSLGFKPGSVSVGLFIGFKTITMTDYFGSVPGLIYNYEHKYKYTLIGARVAYHLDILKNKRIDTYVAAMLQYNIVSFSEKTNNKEFEKYTVWDSTGTPRVYTINRTPKPHSYLSTSIFVGCRYYITNNIGVFAEAGYGIYYFACGVSVKFKT